MFPIFLKFSHVLRLSQFFLSAILQLIRSSIILNMFLKILFRVHVFLNFCFSYCSTSFIFTYFTTFSHVLSNFPSCQNSKNVYVFLDVSMCPTIVLFSISPVQETKRTKRSVTLVKVAQCTNHPSGPHGQSLCDVQIAALVCSRHHANVCQAFNFECRRHSVCVRE